MWIAKHVALELCNHRIQLTGGIQRRACIIEVVVPRRKAAPNFSGVEGVYAAPVAILAAVLLQKCSLGCCYGR